jgi:hypothetical protein
VSNFDVVSKTQGIKNVSHPLLLEILALRPWPSISRLRYATYYIRVYKVPKP